MPAAESAPPSKPPIGKFELSEHLWLIARWYYGNDRQGEIFFHNDVGRQAGWPYRRILRACSRLLVPEEETPADKQSEESATAQQPPAPTPVTQNAKRSRSRTTKKTESPQQSLFDKSSNEGAT